MADAIDGPLVRAMTPLDAEAVLRIYQEGLDSGQASFETAAPTCDSASSCHDVSIPSPAFERAVSRGFRRPGGNAH